MNPSVNVWLIDPHLSHARKLTAHLAQFKFFSISHYPNLPADLEAPRSDLPDLCVLAQNFDWGDKDSLAPVLERLSARLAVIQLVNNDYLAHSVQDWFTNSQIPFMIAADDPGTLGISLVNAYKAYRQQQASQEKIDGLQYQGLLLNNVRDAVVVWNLEGIVTYLNHAAIIQYGLDPAQIIGKPAQQAYLKLFKPPVVTPNPENTLYEDEREYQTPHLRRGWVSSRLSILRDFKAARIIGYMDVSRDITAKKQMEAQIQAAQTQLAQSARMAAIGELAAGIAHQINNPLTTIIADAQLLQHLLPEGHPGQESIEAIQAAGWRTQTIVQQLADFSQNSSAALEDVQVNHTIYRAINLIGKHIQNSGTALEVELAEQLPILQGFSRELEDLWVNLLLLAREATSQKPDRTIWVTSHLLRPLTDEAGLIQVTVRDNGVLIPPEFMSDLFEPNFTRPSIGRGTGIELSICSQIVKRHQGSIQVESGAEGGTTFIIRLPVKENL